MKEQSNAALNADPRTRAVQRRVVISLSLAQLFSGLGHGAGLAIGSLLAVELTGSEALAGTSTMAISLAAALAALPLAGAAARSGRRRALVTGLLLALLGSALMALAPVTGSFAVLLAGSALLGVGNAANLQARFAAVDLAEPQHRGRDLAFVVWSITVGAVAGPNLIRPGAELGAALGLPESSGPFLFSMAGMAIGATLLLMGLRPDPLRYARSRGTGPGPEESLPVQRRGTLRTGMAAVRQQPMAMLGLSAVVGAHLVMVAVMSMTPVHLQALDQAGGHQHSQTDTFAIIGFTISLHMAGMYALSPLMGWLTDRLGRTPTIILGQLMLLAAAALAGVGEQDTWLVGAGLMLLGLGWSASVIAGSTLLAESVPDAGRIPAQGLSDTLMGAAGALGAAFSGPVLAALGFAGLNAAAAVVAAVLLGAAATAWRRDVRAGAVS
ncbi:MFS transporter [Arthrobacter sulfonylureivorans]|uniref:MFS transporter n=1 Tax=Arthrobacter sulfonylureivorans TaxID=2486855 RepID=A0ABY3W3D2_9MICC|nr:MFS transporter [Arthrobacter sulfonylureivorans]UNK44545.1 MFS transporter [Arthrobacter sulfonylureivorans]